jgi:imidazolonepropionase-like amidohydrolase
VLVLAAARVFDGEELLSLRAPALQVSDDGRIAGVVERSQLPADQPVLDLGAVTLLPGLVDTHTHLCFDASTNPVQALAQLSDEQLAARIDRHAEQALAAGVTTVRDLGDRRFATLGAARRYLVEGPSRPHLLCAGPPITTPAGHCHFLGGVLDTPESAPELIRHWAERGVDVIKVMVTGGTMTPGSDALDLQFPEQQLRTLVEHAHRHGLPVTAHAHAASGIRAAVRAGVDGLEHAKFWVPAGLEPDWEVVEQLAERGIAVCPTLGALPGAPPPPPAVAARAEQARALVGQLAERGVVLIAGSDAGISPAKPHDVLPYSIMELAGCGVPNPAALRSATSVAADACRLPGKGRLRPGCDADLLAVDGDPVADLTALLRPRAVYRMGRLAWSATLPDGALV